MTEMRIGIPRDLIIHPGETIADILDARGITQAELAVRTGITPAYISMVIAGKKDISDKFAMSLEYALDVPKTFWINLQAHYDAENRGDF
ncbi:MAG: HigA family addiction module antitoxin [Anaerovibrio sp.]